jgi:transcriptional regulator with XRE-family HTH domain
MSKARPNEMDRIIGRRIRSVREQEGYTLVSFAKKTGLAFNTIAKHERGETSLTVHRLIAIADALEWPIDFFIAGLAQEEQ